LTLLTSHNISYTITRTHRPTHGDTGTQTDRQTYIHTYTTIVHYTAAYQSNVIPVIRDMRVRTQPRSIVALKTINHDVNE